MSRLIVRVLALGYVFTIGSCWFSDQARAGILLGPPKITPVGDPSYVYEVPIILQAGDTIAPVSLDGSNPVNSLTDSYMTIYNLNAFPHFLGFFSDPDRLHGLTDFSAEINNAGFGPTPTAQIPFAPAPVAGSYDLTFYELKGSFPVTNSGTTDLILGYLVFRTNLPEGVEPTGVLDYTDQDLHGRPPTLQSGHGSVRPVPEPASFGAIALGAVLVSGYARRRRNS